MCSCAPVTPALWRRETGGLAGCQPSLSFSERPFLKGIRKIMTEKIAEVVLWLLHTCTGSGKCPPTHTHKGSKRVNGGRGEERRMCEGQKAHLLTVLASLAEIQELVPSTQVRRVRWHTAASHSSFRRSYILFMASVGNFTYNAHRHIDIHTNKSKTNI